MKISTLAISSILTAFLLLSTACSSSDDTEPSNDSGEAHTYDITLDGQRYAGEVDNVYGTGGENGAVTAISTFQQEEGKTFIGFSLKNNDIFISGVLEYPNGQGGNISMGEDSNSFITLKPSAGIGCDSKTGTAKVVVGETLTFGEGIPAFAAITLEFSGIFSYLDNNNDEQTLPVSGEIQINLPPGY